MKRKLLLLLGGVALGVAVLFVGVWFLLFLDRHCYFNPRMQGLRCNNNLRQIDSSKEQAALALHLSGTALVTEAQITPYMKGNQMPMCPAGGTYSINPMNKTPSCSLRPADRNDPCHQLPGPE